jgi:hypothetical protein
MSTSRMRTSMNNYSMNNMSVASAYSVSGRKTPLKRQSSLNKSLNKSSLNNSYSQRMIQPQTQRSLRTVPQYSSGSDTKSKSSKKITANYETPKSKVVQKKSGTNKIVRNTKNTMLSEYYSIFNGQM